MPAVYESQFVRQVRFDGELLVVVDGKANKAVMKI